MLFYPQEKIALFVDGANLYGAAKGLQFDIDYKRLLELFARKGWCAPSITRHWPKTRSFPP